MVHRKKPQTEMKKQRVRVVNHATERMCDSVSVCALHGALKHTHRVSMSPCSRLEGVKLIHFNA